MKSIEKENSIEWYYLLPLMFIITLLPLIVYLKVIPLTGASYDFWNGAKDNLDFFSYYKGVWLLIATGFTLFVYLLRLFQSDSKLIKKDLRIYYFAVGVYVLFVIGSTIFSMYPGIALSGFPDRYEGVYVLVAYILVFFFTTSFVSNEKHIKLMLSSLIIGAIAIGTIGLFQYLGYDIWKSDFGKSLILPSQYKNMADKLQFQFVKHTIYVTLYHTDYVGSYMAMLFPLSFSMLVLTKNKGFKLFMSFITVLMAVNWLGSNSRAGMVGGVLALIVFLILINKLIIRYWKHFGAGIVIAVVVFFGLNQISHGYLGTRINSLVTDAKSIIGSKENSTVNMSSIPLKDIQIKGKQGTVVTSTDTLSFTFNNNQLTFADGNNRPLVSSYNMTDGKITLQDPKYKDYALVTGKMGNDTVLKVDKGDIKLLFELKQSGIFLIDNKGRVVDLKPVQAWGFKGNERIGSSRGYIWSRSLPLLKNTLFLGYGPDTFAAYFPQNDIMGKMYAYYGDMWQIVDKPHDLYLQIALNTGVISLLAILVLLGLYIVKSIRIFILTSYDDFLSQAGISVFVAIVGYLGAAFFNDSIVSVAPVFWILLGLGVSINHMITIREKNNNEDFNSRGKAIKSL